MSVHTLKQRVAEYAVEQALKEQEKLFEQEELDERQSYL